MTSGLETTDTWFVFGLPWWPFDGSVVAALVALLGTIATIWYAAWRFRKSEENQTARLNEAEVNQTARHQETLAVTQRASERELLIQDLRRAEEALARDDEAHWIYAGVILRNVNESEYATDADRRRAVASVAAYAERVSPQDL